jgi:hypothetical protein
LFARLLCKAPPAAPVPSEICRDAAWATLPATDQHVKALAINAVHHRTQHQMHMHVADIQKALGSWLQSLPVDGKW